MRLALALLACLPFAACGRKESGPAAACPHDPAFDRSGLISVRADIPPAVLRRDLDLAGIARLAIDGSKPQGLTEVEHRLVFRTLVNVETRQGRSCIWFDEVRVDMTPAAVRIFVPREYPENSCESLAVLAHEREHEAVHGERLTAAAKEIEEALKAAAWLPARGNPLPVDDRVAAEAALEAKIRKVAAPVYDKYKEDLSKAQAELDKPALYQWVSKRCAGWK